MVVIIAFASMRYYEKNGHWPFMKPKAKDIDDEALENDSSHGSNDARDESPEKSAGGPNVPASVVVRDREVPA